jgi:hypothetical protein
MSEQVSTATGTPGDPFPYNWNPTVNFPYYPYSPPVYVQQGWQCPVCQKVYAPFMPICSTCPPKIVTGTNAQ